MLLFNFIVYILKHISTLHSSFYYSFLNMNYNNIIGFILFIIYIIQFITGLLLSIYYQDYYLIVFDSILYIFIDLYFGYLIRLIHIIGSSIFMLAIYIHLLRAI